MIDFDTTDFDIWEFRRLGTPENILVKAGIFSVADHPDGMSLMDGPKLSSLFGGQEVPLITAIAPAMINIVIAHAFEKCGFLSFRDIRMQAAGILRQAGITNEGFYKLDNAIAEAIEMAKKDLAEERLARR